MEARAPAPSAIRRVFDAALRDARALLLPRVPRGPMGYRLGAILTWLFAAVAFGGLLVFLPTAAEAAGFGLDILRGIGWEVQQDPGWLLWPGIVVLAFLAFAGLSFLCVIVIALLVLGCLFHFPATTHAAWVRRDSRALGLTRACGLIVATLGAAGLQAQPDDGGPNSPVWIAASVALLLAGILVLSLPSWPSVRAMFEPPRA